MRYSPILSFLCFTILLAACGGGEEQNNNSTKDEITEIQDTTTLDTLQTEEPFEGEIYTAYAAVDGPDDALWIHKPGEWDGTAEEGLPYYDMLHVIPYEDWGDEDYLAMTAIIHDNFKIWGELGERDVPVVLFFDREKTKIAGEYSLYGNGADGIATLYTPEGEIFIQREYDRGRWTESIVAPYSADWKFVQSASELWIKDPVPFEKDKNGNRLHKLMPTVQEKGPGDNTLYKILEKESYSKQFQINDRVFSGTLQGYYEPGNVEYEPLQFELQFVDGWLHGDIKIYNDWGELALHEIFDMGELDSTVYEIDYGDMDGMAKPIIYIYPEEEIEVSVNLQLKGHLTHSYPKYNKGWKLTAQPDGTLTCGGKEYYALYWEGENDVDFEVNEGFVVPGEETAAFLEEALSILGLNRREANEFIVFWLPILEDNPYNLIHFSSSQYEEIAQLRINPKPETLIRVMMVYQPLDHPIDLPLQDLNKLKKERKGFTVVEWGGSLLEDKISEEVSME